MSKVNKTNAMRLLDAANIPYVVKTYPIDADNLSGEHTAALLNINPEALFKTLVLQTNEADSIVCCIPSNYNINFKQVAKLYQVKKVELLPLNQLLTLTGYIRGGCSPIGMKKQLPTFIDESIQLFDEVCISSGTRGMLLILHVPDFLTFVQPTLANIIID